MSPSPSPSPSSSPSSHPPSPHNKNHPTDRIHQVNSATKDAYTFYPVVVIGAGESGICMGARLQQVLGFDQFRIFERRSQLGGTWFASRYPGIACDIPAVLYSFSFSQNPNWTAPYPSGKEIVRYLYDVCARFKILDKIQCDVNVKSLVWKDEDEEWEIILEHFQPGIGDLSSEERNAIEKEKGPDAIVVRVERVRAKCVASAVGVLVEPKPAVDLPGKEKFKGRIVHTARWDEDIDLKDKNVVVVGTGCSAGQLIPQLIKPDFGPVKSVTQLLRSPPWTVPGFSKEGTKTYTNWMPGLCTYIPGFQNTFRKLFFTLIEAEFLSLFSISEAARERRKTKGVELLEYMRSKVPPEYHQILTPDYEVSCKRRVIDDGWFDSLADARVNITSMPLTSFGPGPEEVTLGPGFHYPPASKTDADPTETKTVPCDILVLASGYTTNQFLHPLDVTGRKGVSIHDLWKARGGAQGYMGTAMDSFPNFFMIFGPNTATGHSSVILASENMTNYALNFIGPIVRGEVDTVEVKESAERAYTDRLQRELKQSVFNSGGCVNWYIDQETGWNSTVYPRTQIDYTLRCMFPRWGHWNVKYTRKGLLALWATRMVKTLNVVAVLLAGIYVLRNGKTATLRRVRESIDGAIVWLRGSLV